VEQQQQSDATAGWSRSFFQDAAEFLKRNQRAVFLVCVLCVGTLVTWPRHNFEQWFDPGDRGRDLYAFERTLHGETPYRDYLWMYGPLMPYVYAAFCGAFGCQISSVILGKLCFTMLAAVFLYLAVSRLFSAFTAFLAASWFLVIYPEFFFTYNHIAGIAMILAVLWAVFSYVESSRVRDAFWGLLWGFVLALIKINFGIVAVAMCVLGVFLTDKLKGTPWQPAKALFYVTAIGLVPVLTCAVYGWFLKDLSVVEIRQCLPYLSDDEPHIMNPLVALVRLIFFIGFTLRTDTIEACMAVLTGFAAIRTIQLLAARKLEPACRARLVAALVVLAVFGAANLHEYLRSGVGYRLLWSQPLGIGLGFVLIDTAFASMGRLVRFQARLAILLMVVVSFTSGLQRIQAQKTHAHFLPGPRANIYLGNTPDWIQTVTAATARLRQELKPGERFFAVPYDPLYYYLTETKSPTRMLMFFEHIKIPREQEQAVINDLERHRVNHVLVANMSKSQEYGFGVLGKTYCPVIGRYIKENFAPIAEYGDWINEPLWSRHHGVRILQRKKPTTTTGPPVPGKQP
jgi:hypothetical protein